MNAYELVEDVELSVDTKTSLSNAFLDSLVVLGLVEYSNWREDMKLTPVLAVYAGISLERDAITGLALMPYVGDVMDELGGRPSPSLFHHSPRHISEMRLIYSE